ncbi:hypothetical protein [Bdellovibrio reynosensis]|uniref:Uncharacterized protein n=1 Tax=Bdellovibrio reynosensis TaxID=2835041 RepID=A0ABY4CFF8_9BACT|nr:hypothetical protein [Bdellovibrio reynosensis]UOF00940.1 hypothetical protein MNR06_14660 [Bdellovibrio reynosensis]
MKPTYYLLLSIPLLLSLSACSQGQGEWSKKARIARSATTKKKTDGVAKKGSEQQKVGSTLEVVPMYGVSLPEDIVNPEGHLLIPAASFKGGQLVSNNSFFFVSNGLKVELEGVVHKSEQNCERIDDMESIKRDLEYKKLYLQSLVSASGKSLEDLHKEKEFKDYICAQLKSETDSKGLRRQEIAALEKKGDEDLVKMKNDLSTCLAEKEAAACEVQTKEKLIAARKEENEKLTNEKVELSRELMNLRFRSHEVCQDAIKLQDTLKRADELAKVITQLSEVDKNISDLNAQEGGTVTLAISNVMAAQTAHLQAANPKLNPQPVHIDAYGLSLISLDDKASKQNSLVLGASIAGQNFKTADLSKIDTKYFSGSNKAHIELRLSRLGMCVKNLSTKIDAHYSTFNYASGKAVFTRKNIIANFASKLNAGEITSKAINDLYKDIKNEENVKFDVDETIKDVTIAAKMKQTMKLELFKHFLVQWTDFNSEKSKTRFEADENDLKKLAMDLNDRVIGHKMKSIDAIVVSLGSATQEDYLNSEVRFDFKVDKKDARKATSFIPLRK